MRRRCWLSASASPTRRSRSKSKIAWTRTASRNSGSRRTASESALERRFGLPVGFEHAPLQLALRLRHLLFVESLGRKVRLADRDAYSGERRRDDELVPGPEDPRRLRRERNRHDGLATDLRGEDRTRLELEARSARPVRRDAWRNALLHDCLVYAAHSTHTGVRARSAHDVRTVHLGEHRGPLAID